MKQRYSNKTLSDSSLKIVVVAEQICLDYQRQGYNLSLRQLYYQFVARGLLANTEPNYKRLGCIISDARLAGLIDWDHIKDRTRQTVENSHWSSPASILNSAARSFRIDLWEGQPNHVEVMVEKQALEGVLLPVCTDHDVPFTANRGYSSSSSFYEIGQRLYDKANEDKELHIIYLGDHDPSGIDMTRDVEERLELFAETTVTVHRVALNMDQVEKYQPPENPAKMTDSRAREYIARFGRSSWELDALEPSLLAALVENKILDLRDDDLFEAQEEKQNTWKDELNDMAEKYRK